ncbi:MAG: carboxypeptidase regulatory-like domain-containing protein, partial [Nocardioides sp.]
MVVTLGPVNPAAGSTEQAPARLPDRTAPASPQGSGEGLTDITDGLPVRGITRDTAGSTDRTEADVPTTLLAAEGAEADVRRAAQDGPVDVIVRLRTQAAADELGEQAAAQGVEAGLDRRERLADRSVASRAVGRQVARAVEIARTTAVVDGLQDVAREGRASIAPTLSELREDGHVTDVQRYWIFNGFAASVDRAGLDALAALPQVASITADEEVQLPEPEPTSAPKLPTWGVERVRATEVWGQFGNRGSGVVLGLMDSGVDLQHPALTDSWRGATGDPAKSWFVSTGEDYATPGDGFGHGTHVAGTMVGGPPGEVVGVAPGATWIAAKIFNDGGGASTSGIHAAFQWMLAPGGDPAARPDVVNNSWGASAPNHPEYRPDVQAWVAAGIVPVFSNGNDGPSAGTVGSPGSFPESFGVGATDVNGVIASFSSRGPVTWDGTELTKPDISAPGHHVISAFPADLGYGEYVDLSGTSMAAPHITGVAGLVLAGNPSLTVDQVESALTATARQEPHMGELPDNDYGHGVVDALAAVNLTSESGTVSGTVTTRGGGTVGGASLVVEGSPWTATTATEQGAFQVVVPTGTHTVRVSAPGQRTTEFTVTMSKGASLLHNVRMTPAGSHELNGTVRGEGARLEGAEVSVAGVGSALTDDDGRFRLTVPGGTHEVVVRATGFEVSTRSVTVTKSTSISVSLEALSTAAADGWTEYQNTPAHTGRTEDAVAPASLRRAWSVDTGPGIIFSSPVIADGKVFVGTTDGQLEARDLETGEQLWAHDVGDQLRGSPAVSDGTVVIGGGIDGGIVALDAQSGEVQWRVETPGQLTVYTQPTVIDGVVYANTGPSEVDDSVIAIDLASGEVLWSTPVAVGVFNGAASDGERLFVTSADEASVVALDRASGEVEWTVTREGEAFYSAASVADGIVYATTTNDAGLDGTVLALDATDGSVVWQRPDHGDAQGSSPAVYGDLVITGTHANGAVVAYDRATGEVAWRYQDSGPVSSSLMTTADGYVLGGSQLDSVVFALDAATGRRVFVDDVGANVTSSGAYDDGTYVTADTSGQLYAYRTTGTVNGSLSGPDGPLAGRVEVVETGTGADADPQTGAYSVDHRPGEYELRASAYGFVTQTRPVTVVGGRTVTEDFTLQPAGTGSVTGTVSDADGAPLAGAEVTLVDTPVQPVASGADGGFAFPEVAAGEYRVRVTLDGYVDHTETVTVADGETASLAVALARYRVAVMGDYQGIMVDTLERLGHTVDVTTYAEVTADPDRYELVIANGAEDRPADGVIAPFIDATDAAGTSVIWLDQWSIGYGSILNLSQQTGDPAEVVTEYQGSGRVSVVNRREHPLTAGLALDTRVPVLANNSEWAAFKGYSGISVADLHVDAGGEVGSAIAYQPRTLGSTHVLLSTFAAAPWGKPEVEWLPIVEDVIGNATAYALDVEYAEVGGTVTDETGAPVAGVAVAVPGTGYRTTTAADGSYSVLVDPGEVTLRFRAPGYTAAERTMTLDPGGTATVDVALAAAADGTVAGTVTDGSGAPVAGATVRIAELEGAQTTTAADGGYALAGIPAEDYLLEVTAAGYLGAERQVTVPAGGTAAVDVVLTTAPRVGILGDHDSELATLLQGAGMTTRALAWSDTAALAELDVVVVNDPPTPTAAAFNGFLAAMDQHRVSGVFGDGYFSSDGGVRFLRQFTGNPSEGRVQVGGVGDLRYRAADPEHPLFAGLGAEPQVLVHDGDATAIPGYTGFPLAELVSETGGEHGVAATYQPRTSGSIHVLLGGLTAGLLIEADEDWTAEGRRLFANSVLFAAEPALGTVEGTVTGEGGEPLAGT